MKKVLDVFFSTGGKREFKGIARKALSAYAIGIALYHLYTFSVGTYEPYTHRSIHLGLILAFCLLTYSPSSKMPRRWLTIDLFFAILSLVIMTYLALNHDRLLFDRIPLEQGSLSRLEVFFGVALILMLLEVSRRAMGPILPLLVVGFLLYAYFGPYLGGIWWHRGFSVVQIVDLTVFTMDGLFTAPLGISATYIILFIIFAALIQQTMAGKFFTQLAHALAGRSMGGPAKIAVVGSAIMGSITGSAVANIAVTGAVTIPMMKRVGFPPYFAGGIEAAASDGGHIMPPVMAGTVFIMSGLTGIPYMDICLAAAIPAVLYFLGIGLQVHFYAVRHGIYGMEEIGGAMPSAWEILRRGWQYFLPIVAITVLMLYGYSPIRAALWSMPIVVGVSWFRKEDRVGIRGILRALASSIEMMKIVMLATALSGIIMGGLFYTGLGHELVAGVGKLSGGTLLIPLLLAAATCFLIGMGASMVAAYVLTAVLIVPATVQLGISQMAANLFAIYFASIAIISPPVGAGFYQAAAMAGASPFRTGWASVRLAFAAFIVPFFFVYNPALLLKGSPVQVALAFIFSLISIFSLAAAIEGWVFREVRFLERILLAIGGFLLMFMSPTQRMAGFCMIIFVLIRQALTARSARASARRGPL